MKEASNPSQIAHVDGGGVYRFGDCEVSVPEGVVRRSGEVVYLRRKTFDVLVFLIDHADRAVSKDELIGALWADTAVTDGSLTQCILEARRALGDDPREPRFIRTLPKVGYRFVADLTPEVADAGRLSVPELTPPPPAPAPTVDRWRPLAAGAVILGLVALALGTWWFQRVDALPTDRPLRTVVLPLENRTSDAALDWWEDGLSEMLATSFSRSSQFAIIGHDQVEAQRSRLAADRRAGAPRDVGAALGADLVVTGGIALVGATTRVDVQLLNVADGTLLGGESVTVQSPEHVLAEVDLLALKLESQLFRKAPTVRTPAVVSAGTADLEAYRLYLQGVRLAERFETREAVEYFERAVARDPEFAAALARIGFTYALKDNRVDMAKPYLQRAFELAHRLTDRDRLLVAAWRSVAEQDFSGAIDAYRMLLADFPTERDGYGALARLLVGEQRFDEARRAIEGGLQVDALWADGYNVLATIYGAERRYAEALAAAQRYAQMVPGEPNAHDSLGLALMAVGRYPDAEAAFRQALSINPEFGVARLHLGNLLTQSGRFIDAIEQFRRHAIADPANAPRSQLAAAFALGLAGRWGEAWHEFHALTDPSPLWAVRLAFLEGDRAAVRSYAARMTPEVMNNRGSRAPTTQFDCSAALAAAVAGDTGSAIAHAQKVADARPVTWDVVTYEDCPADVRMALGQWDEALHELDRLVAVNQLFPRAQYRRALVLERLGRRESATEALRAFVTGWSAADDSAPELVEARRRLGGSR